MLAMSSSIETRFQVNQKAGEALDLIWKALGDMGLSGLTNVKEIPSYTGPSVVRRPSYVLLEYKLGLFGLDSREIELTFSERPSKTLISVKWSYPTFESERRRGPSGLLGLLYERNARDTRQNTVWAVEELKSRVGGAEIVDDEPAVREIIKEKEVIAKIRCEYCGILFDESFDRCSNCGAGVPGKRRSEHQRFCPYCGTERKQDIGEYCAKCGEKIA
jgi:hypothetical protein